MPAPHGTGVKEKATEIAFGAIKYVVWVGVVVGSVAAVFYSSQSNQDARTAEVCGRVTAAETDIKILHRSDDNTASIIDSTKKDLAKTREEMTKLATSQEAIAREQAKLGDDQRKLGDKMDDLKTILIRMERSNP